MSYEMASGLGLPASGFGLPTSVTLLEAKSYITNSENSLFPD